MTTPGVKHLNPRQGITTQYAADAAAGADAEHRVKHLNPRQGITTSGSSAYAAMPATISV